MNWSSRLFNWLRPSPRRSDSAGVGHHRLSKSGILSLLSRYDAAVTNDDNRRHWAAADGLSANTANNPDVRRTLRNRSRYEVANNSYAQGIVRTLANDVIGTGPRLQMLTEDPDANRRIESEFAEWSQAIRLAEKLRTLRMSQTTDGEAFAILANNPSIRSRIQLDLRLVEADQVTTSDPFYGGPHSLTSNPVDGIVFDSFGNPIEYHVLKEHPGSESFQFGLNYDRIPAHAMIHLFRTDRGSHRDDRHQRQHAAVGRRDLGHERFRARSHRFG